MTKFCWKCGSYAVRWWVVRDEGGPWIMGMCGLHKPGLAEDPLSGPLGPDEAAAAEILLS